MAGRRAIIEHYFSMQDDENLVAACDARQHQNNAG
jgi:hypothetical protein